MQPTRFPLDEKRISQPATTSCRTYPSDDPTRPWAREANPPTPGRVLDHRLLGYRYADEAS